MVHTNTLAQVFASHVSGVAIQISTDEGGGTL